MSEKLKQILEKSLENILCNEVDKVEMKKFGNFSYGVFNPDDEDSEL